MTVQERFTYTRKPGLRVCYPEWRKLITQSNWIDLTPSFLLLGLKCEHVSQKKLQDLAQGQDVQTHLLLLFEEIKKKKANLPILK